MRSLTFGRLTAKRAWLALAGAAGPGRSGAHVISATLGQVQIHTWGRCSMSGRGRQVGGHQSRASSLFFEAGQGAGCGPLACLLRWRPWRCMPS